jgi:hypothetical protein
VAPEQVEPASLQHSGRFGEFNSSGRQRSLMMI